MEGSSNSAFTYDGDDIVVTPCLQPLNMDLPLTFDGTENSNVTYEKEDCESPLSSSSWDSEPETDISPVINCDDISEEPLEGITVNLDENYLDMEQDNQFVEVENTDDNLLWEMDNRSYDELLKKLLEREEELRVSNFKLELSEQENMKLKVQVENSEVKLDNVFEELKLKEGKVHKQKELSEIEIFKSKIQLETANLQLKKSKEEIAMLTKELGIKSSKTHQLQDQLRKTQKKLAESESLVVLKSNHIQKLENLVTIHDRGLQKLKSKMLDSQGKAATKICFNDNDKLDLDLKRCMGKLKSYIGKLDEKLEFDMDVKSYIGKLKRYIGKLEVGMEELKQRGY